MISNVLLLCSNIFLCLNGKTFMFYKCNGSYDSRVKNAEITMPALHNLFTDGRTNVLVFK